jgi:hypothetical protein
MRRHAFRPEDFRAHGFALREAGARDMLAPDLARALEDLWFEFRNENDYRSGIPGSATAQGMLKLAEELHAQLVARRADSRAACRRERSRG